MIIMLAYSTHLPRAYPVPVSIPVPGIIASRDMYRIEGPNMIRDNSNQDIASIKYDEEHSETLHFPIEADSFKSWDGRAEQTHLEHLSGPLADYRSTLISAGWPLSSINFPLRNRTQHDTAGPACPPSPAYTRKAFSTQAPYP